MGFFQDLLGNFTGSQSRDDLTRGRTEADTALTRARDDARGRYDDAQRYIDSGSQGAQEFLQRGLDTGRGDITGASTKQINALTEGKKGALGQIQPQIDSGRANLKMIDDINGVNGPEAAAKAIEAYHSSPGLQASINRTLKSTDAAARARGQPDGGNASLAAARAGQEAEYGDYQNWKGSVQHQSDTGGQYAGKAADIETGWGKDTAGVYGHEGDTLAGLTSGAYGSMATNALTAGKAKAGIAGEQAGAEYGYGRDIAGNANNYWGNMGNTRSTGMNNLFQLGSLAVGAYTGYSMPRTRSNTGTTNNYYGGQAAP